jgi:hypothetical protein
MSISNTARHTASKRVVSVEKAPPRHWVGDGFPVASMFSYDSAPKLSPFLLLDYAAPAEFRPALRARGVGEHPHRGFETVTVVYQGEVEHKDSTGNAGLIGPGDVQWMTAAAGIVHEEMHSREFTQKGGTMEMVQLWVNLPAKFKKAPAGYQDILKSRISSWPSRTARARYGSSPASSRHGNADTAKGRLARSRRSTCGICASRRRRRRFRVPEGHATALLFLRGGGLVNGADSVDEGGLAVLDRNGSEVSIEAGSDATVLLLSGAPIDEPVVGYGPFVMNTQGEIRQAREDYRNGKMGHCDLRSGGAPRRLGAPFARRRSRADRGARPALRAGEKLAAAPR